MKYNVPDLYRKSRNGMLTQDEINWVEQQVRHFPFFQLHQVVLAQQEFITPAGNPYIEKGLIHSTNRKAMAALLIEDPDQDLFTPSAENKIALTPTPAYIMPTPEIRISVPETQPESAPVFPVNPIPLPAENIADPVHENTIQETVLLTQEESVENEFGSEIQIQPQAENTWNETPEHVSPVTSESISDLPETISTRNIAAEADAAPETKPETRILTLSAAEQKLDYKIKFRLQMFSWRIQQIQQQTELNKNKILQAQSKEAGFNSANEFIQHSPVKSWDLPVVPTELNGAFEPDFPVLLPVEKSSEPLKHTVISAKEIAPESPLEIQENTSGNTDPEVIHQIEPVLPAYLEFDLPEFNLNSETEKETDSPLATENTQHSKDAVISQENGNLTIQHNDLTIELVVSPESSRKYLKKNIADLLVNQAPAGKEIPVNHQPLISGKRKPDRRKVMDIIDRFIELEPEIGMKPRMTEGRQEDISRRSAIDNGEIISETLALIYLKQGNKNKAIRIYEKLMLKFPEKSSYFEALLKKI